MSRSLPRLYPGTCVSAALWPSVDPQLPAGSIVRTDAESGKVWTKKDDDCWYQADKQDVFRTHFDRPVTLVRVGFPGYTL